MPILVKAPEKQVYEQLPAGNYQGVCYMVSDIGTQEFTWQGEVKHAHQVVLLYEVDEVMKEGKLAGKRFVVSETLTLSFHEKAKLLQRIQGWLGRELSKEEMDGFDLESLIGKNCSINIITNDKGYAKIGSVSPLMKGMKDILPENVEAPKWVAERFQNSEEIKAFTKGKKD